MLPARPLPRRLIRPLSAPFLHPDSSLLDAAGGFTATIDWGDGTATPGTVNGSNGNFTVTGSHTYDEGNFTPTVVVVRTADQTQLTVVGGTATVSETDVLTPTPQQNQPPISIIPGQPFGGPVATFTDSNTANVASDFTAMIDWGDGTTSTGVVNGSNGSFTVSSPVLHTYASTGHFSITVTIADDAPGTATTTATNTAFVGAILTPGQQPPGCGRRLHGDDRLGRRDGDARDGERLER